MPKQIIITFIFLCGVFQTTFALTPPSHKPIKAVLFDVFGTVVDWRGSMVTEFTPLFKKKNIQVDAELFVKDWVMTYADNMERINNNPKSFQTVDELNKLSLDETLKKHHLFTKFSHAERSQMWLSWHRLNPWPDSVKGLNQLKRHYIIGTLTNGNIKLMIDLSKHAQLPWDVIFSGEFFKRYKPDPKVYQSAAQFLNLPANQILLVASHKFDLRAAKALGFQTAYVFRPKEFAVIEKDQLPIKNEFDYNVASIKALDVLLPIPH